MADDRLNEHLGLRARPAGGAATEAGSAVSRD